MTSDVFTIALRFLSLHLVFLPPSSSCFLIAGVPSEGLLHGEPGSSAAHHGGLLEDDLGVEKLLHSHAYRAGGERAGWWMCAQSRDGQRLWRSQVDSVF